MSGDNQHGTSIRESLSAAFDTQVEAATTAATSVESAAETVAATEQAGAQQTARERDEAGRFAAKAKEAESTTKAEVKTEATAAAGAEPKEGAAKATDAVEAAPAERAPQSWTAAAREEWAKVPGPVRQEVLRREKEVSRALSETAAARKLAQEFEATAAPYRALFTAPPVQVAANLFQTAAALQTGDIPTKAAIIAQMIRNFGVPEGAIADVLEGKQPAQQAQGQYRDPRVDDLLRRQQMAEQQSQQAQVAQARQQLDAFMANAEFIQDVWPDMAALLETGRASTYEEAYSKACRMSEEVGKVLRQRQEAKAKETAQAATQRAKAAASSVRNEPAAPSSGAQPTSVRGALEAAWAAHSGR